MNSFGQQLRTYRRQCTDPQRGGLLTQERFGELMGVVLGDAGYSGAAVSDWERDKSKIHADDRAVLVALLTVLRQNGGISKQEAGDDLLAAGNYRRLDLDEALTVFPDEAEVQTVTTQQAAPREMAGRSRTQRILLEKVNSFWVDGVLKESIAGAPILTLDKTDVFTAVDHPWDDSLGPALIERGSTAGDDILTLFEDADRALLILGSPGCGKTMTLITLAGHLLEEARHDPQVPVPVILDLSGWAKERRDMVDWIVEELTAKYQIPRRYGRRWLAGDDLILLLDGFDVLPPNARGSCVRAVNRFRESNGLIGLAVCSRSQEYLDSGLKFCLNRAVKIQPLDQEQIDRYLTGEDHHALRLEVDKNPAARQMAQSPLMLNVLVAVTVDDAAGGSSDAFASAPGLASQVGYVHVFDAYTRRMFRRRPSSAPFDPEQTLKYLYWLAGRLEEHSQSIFLIEGIQPSWLPSKWWRWIYMLLSGLILGLAGGLIMWLLWRLLRHTLPQLPAVVSTQLAAWLNLAREPVELLTILLGNLALGLLMGVILGLFFEHRRQKPVEAARVNRQRWLQVWTVGLITGGVTTLFVSLFTGWLLSLARGVAEGFMYMAAARFIFGWSYESDVRTVEALGWSWKRSLTGSGVGLILTLIAETLEILLYGYNGFERTLVTLVLAGFILGGLTGSGTTTKSRPNQGVWLSLRNAGKAAVFLALPLALVTGVMRDTPYALNIGVLSALIAAALFGGGVFVKHFLLRGLLRRQRSLPWRYSRFLDHAAQLVFLRKVGGGYIFMHRLLQEYFAGLGAGRDC
jgi:MFS family permease